MNPFRSIDLPLRSPAPPPPCFLSSPISRAGVTSLDATPRAAPLIVRHSRKGGSEPPSTRPARGLSQARGSILNENLFSPGPCAKAPPTKQRGWRAMAPRKARTLFWCKQHACGFSQHLHSLKPKPRSVFAHAHKVWGQGTHETPRARRRDLKMSTRPARPRCYCPFCKLPWTYPGTWRHWRDRSDTRTSRSYS